MIVLMEYLGTIESGPVFTLGMATGLRNNGVDVYCVLSDKIENKQQWIDIFGMDHLAFIRVTPKKSKPISTSVTFFYDCIKAQKKYKNVNFDTVIRTFIHPFDTVVSKFFNYNKTVNLCHDPIPHSSMDKRLAKEYQSQMKNSDDIIVLTKAFIPIIENIYKKDRTHIHYMRHGLMTYQRGLNDAIIENPLESINFLFFGRIDGYKGLHILAGAYKLVTEKYSNVSLTVAGSGSFSEYEREYSKLPNVKIINRYIKEEEVEGIFNTGNTVVVLPYIDATQSGVIPIAFDFGIPVIASKTGGLVEQLIDGKYGILFETGSIIELSKSMMRFLDSSTLYNSEADKMEEGKDLLNWENVTKEMLEQWD